MEELNHKELDKIPIPKGLEERLSMKIDEWDAAERKQQPTTISIVLRRTVSIAATIAVVLCAGLYYFQPLQPKGEIDSFSDPEEAYLEAERALMLLSTNLNKGIAQYERVNAQCTFQNDNPD